MNNCGELLSTLSGMQFEAMKDGGTLDIATRVHADKWIEIVFMDSGEGIAEKTSIRYLPLFSALKSAAPVLGCL